MLAALIKGINTLDRTYTYRGGGYITQNTYTE